MPSTPLDTVTIRRPYDAEGPACRLLLPDQKARPRGPSEYFVAVQEAAPRIVGAASFQPGATAFFGLRIRVVRPRRRQGIGTQLVQHIVGEALRRQANALLARADSLAEPDAAPFLLAQGFRFLGRTTAVEADMLPMRDFLVGLRVRLLAAGKVPAGARLLQLSEAPVDQIARLYAQYIQHNPEADPAVLRQPGFREQAASSPVLLVDDRVAGFLLVGLENGLSTVHARVVAPGLRGGWVNALLMGTAMEDQWNAGGRRVRFDIPPGNRDTGKLAWRFGAQIVGAWDGYAHRLEEAPQNRYRQRAVKDGKISPL